jgi:holo-[acyl-carrier protein] synthase
MILGLGIDLTPVERMRQAMDNHPERLEARLFTDGERRYCHERAKAEEHFAARFAAKEAVLKALAVPSGLSWHELEVVSGAGGAPRLELTGQAAKVAKARGIERVHLSLTHAGGNAMAVVVLEGQLPPARSV